MKLLPLGKYLVALTLTSLALSAHSGDLEIGYIDDVSIQNLQLLVDDQPVLLSRFTVVNNYGNDSDLLPLTALRPGRIVGMELEYSPSSDLPTVAKIILIPNETIKQSLIDSQNKD